MEGDTPPENELSAKRVRNVSIVSKNFGGLYTNIIVNWRGGGGYSCFLSAYPCCRQILWDTSLVQLLRDALLRMRTHDLPAQWSHL